MFSGLSWHWVPWPLGGSSPGGTHRAQRKPSSYVCVRVQAHQCSAALAPHPQISWRQGHMCTRAGMCRARRHTHAQVQSHAVHCVLRRLSTRDYQSVDEDMDPSRQERIKQGVI